MRAIMNLILVVFGSLIFIVNLQAQEFILSKNSSIIVSGTSSLHDWDVEAESFSGKISLTETTEIAIKKLEVNVVAESLKSGKRGMDKNTYKALKTDTHKTITIRLVKANNITKINDNTYKVKCDGSLSVAGTTKLVSLDFLLSLDETEGELSNCSMVGSCAIAMTKFNIDPPTALLGAIKTGDAVTIKFNTKFLRE